jgi:hypothetical protein
LQIIDLVKLMFVVYTPEGQSFIGAVQNLPSLKVGPVARIHKLKKPKLDEFNVKSNEQGTSNYKSTEALEAYKKNKRIPVEPLWLKWQKLCLLLLKR